MAKPVKILYVNGGLMRRGGIESFMMNYFRRFDRSLVTIDFAVHGFGEGAYDREIEEYGSKIYHLPVKSKQPFAYERALEKILKAEKYQIIHSHADAMSCWVLKVAKKCGVPVRIAHSHNTNHLTSNPVKYLVNEFARKNIVNYATHLFACSKAAGEWLFGKSHFTVVPNAVELEKFYYSEEKGKSLRKEYGVLPSDFVIGHVGRLDEQKNHLFLLDVFQRYARQNENAKLVLIGEGQLREKIEQKISAYNLKDRVLLLGARENVNELYNMMDVFVLPSLFEGLGIVAIEAQANGLYCLLSHNVPSQALVANRGEFLPLNVSAWVDALKKSEKSQRVSIVKQLRYAGYDIAQESRNLQDFYLSFQEK